MKKIILFVLFFILQIVGCSKIEYPWFNGTFDDALASMGDKVLLLDFYTDT